MDVFQTYFPKLGRQLYCQMTFTEILLGCTNTHTSKQQRQETSLSLTMATGKKQQNEIHPGWSENAPV